MIKINNNVEVFEASVELRLSSKDGKRVIEIHDSGVIDCWENHEDLPGRICKKVFILDEDGFDNLWGFIVREEPRE